MDPETHLVLRQLKHRYCHAIDTGDYGEWVSLFADDGAFVRVGVDRYDGHEELATFANDVFDEAFDFSAHTVSNPVIDVDGDEATGTWYVTLRFETPDGERGWKQAVYEDTFRRVDGEWRFETVRIAGRAESE